MTETMSVELEPAVKEKLKEIAKTSSLSPEFLSSMVLTLFATEGGTVWTGIWSKGRRIVVDMPTRSHFVILKVKREG